MGGREKHSFIGGVFFRVVPTHKETGYERVTWEVAFGFTLGSECTNSVGKGERCCYQTARSYQVVHFAIMYRSHASKTEFPVSKEMRARERLSYPPKLTPYLDSRPRIHPREPLYIVP